MKDLAARGVTRVRLTNLMVCVVLALTVAVIGPSAMARGPSPASVTKTAAGSCRAGTVKTAGGRIYLSGYRCTLSGKTIPAARLVVTKSYQLKDYYGSACGAVTAPTAGPSFVPAPAGAYTVKVKFVVTAPKYMGVRPATTNWRTVTLNGWRLQCGVIGTQSKGSVCDYPFGGLPDKSICGQVFKLSGSTGRLPLIGSTPIQRGNTILSPQILESSGQCHAENIGQPSAWMGVDQQNARWRCDNGDVVVFVVYLYYFQPDNSYCVTPAATNGDPYAAGPGNLPNHGKYTSFTLPPGWQSWGGRLGVVFEAILYSHDSFPKGSDPENYSQDAYQYTDYAMYLNGKVNACSQLMQVSG